MLLLCSFWSAQRPQFQVGAAVFVLSPTKTILFEWSSAIIQQNAAKISVQWWTEDYRKFIWTEKNRKVELDRRIVQPYPMENQWDEKPNWK